MIPKLSCPTLPRTQKRSDLNQEIPRRYPDTTKLTLSPKEQVPFFPVIPQKDINLIELCVMRRMSTTCQYSVPDKGALHPTGHHPEGQPQAYMSIGRLSHNHAELPLPHPQEGHHWRYSLDENNSGIVQLFLDNGSQTNGFPSL